MALHRRLSLNLSVPQPKRDRNKSNLPTPLFQEIKDDAGQDTPMTVTVALEVTVRTSSLRLVEGSKLGAAAAAKGSQEKDGQICSASMSGLSLQLLSYPKTMSLTVVVAQALIESASGGPLFRTAQAQPPEWPSPDSPSATSPPRSPSTSTSASAFRLEVVSRPQDGSADLTVMLHVAPSYATYSAAAINGIASFFSLGKEQGALQLTILQVRIVLLQEGSGSWSVLLTFPPSEP